MKLEDRINAVAELGFSERQARFLDLVMMFGGLCVPRQYATFARTAYGRRVSRFFDKLVQRGYATVSDCLHNRAELYHVRHRALYRAIDQLHSRHRQPVPARHVIDRLMRLDAIVLQPDLIWLATEEEKVAFFSLMAPSLPRERLPHIMVGKGARGRLRLFPEDQPAKGLRPLISPSPLGWLPVSFAALRAARTAMRTGKRVQNSRSGPHSGPIGVTTTGRVVFTYLVTAWETATLRALVQRHADLLRMLPGWTLRLVFTQQLADATAHFEGGGS